MCRAISRQSTARPSVAAAATVDLRTFARSRAGPRSGATIANGVIVTSRYSATSVRAESAGTVKNNDPASATATNASPARLVAYARASARKGVRVVKVLADELVDLGGEHEVVACE